MGGHVVSFPDVMPGCSGRSRLGTGSLGRSRDRERLALPPPGPWVQARDRRSVVQRPRRPRILAVSFRRGSSFLEGHAGTSVLADAGPAAVGDRPARPGARR